jgi:hypothetical protein
VALAIVLTLAGQVIGGEPLHAKIDRLIEAKLDQSPAAPATDGEFLRRCFLDLAGMIPTAAEARAFLDDPSPYKRQRLIDTLLASTSYPRRMQYVFDAMLMERRDDTHVPAPGWQQFLLDAFAQNVPYDELVIAILSADGSDPATRARAKFYLDRLGDPNLLTRDVGRLFLGRDLQCAQCHDHPLIDDYKQAHYYGIFAFLNRTVLFEDDAKFATLGEKADGEVTFSSVFKKKVSHSTKPRILDGPAEPEPAVPKGAEYLVAPGKDNKVRPVPRFSRRALLARRLVAGSGPDFSKNIANRLWALMMGRGLVDPPDLHHSENPAADPELLGLLAQEFVAMRYDIKAFLRELALTRVYERSSEPPPGVSLADRPANALAFVVAPLKTETPEQLAWSVMQALGVVAQTRAQVEERLDGHDPKMRAILATDAKRQALRATLIEAGVHDGLQANVAVFVRQFAAAAGQPQEATEPTVHQALFLSNGGQIQAWLAPSKGNLVDRLAAALNEVATPREGEQSSAPSAAKGTKKDPSQGAAVGQKSPGDDRRSKMAGRDSADFSRIAEELYLSIYTRRPTEEERATVARYITDRGNDRVAAIQELAWAMLASTEFRFNH